MKNKLSIIILLHVVLLYACTTNKSGLSNNHLSSQKLANIQVLTPCKDNIKTGVESNKYLGKKTDTNEIAPLHSTATIAYFPSSKTQLNKGLAALKFLPETVKHKLKNVSTSSSYITSVASQPGSTKNPYMPPLLTFTGVWIMFAIIFGLALPGIGLEAVGGIAFLFILSIALVTFLLLALATKEENYGSSLTTSYFLAWFFGLLAAPFPLLMLFDGVAFIIPSVILVAASLIFFVLWLKHLGENKLHDTEPRKGRRIVYLIVSIAALLGIYFMGYLSTSFFAPIFFYILILLALTTIFFFVLWLVKKYKLKSKAS